jgi:hypothetical protein
VSHRPAPEGWRPEAPFHFVDGVEAAMARAQELAGDRTVEVAAGDVGGQMLAAGSSTRCAMDVAPVVIGSGKRYFGSVAAQHLLEDPDVVIQATGCSTCATGCADDGRTTALTEHRGALLGRAPAAHRARAAIAAPGARGHHATDPSNVVTASACPIPRSADKSTSA